MLRSKRCFVLRGCDCACKHQPTVWILWSAVFSRQFYFKYHAASGRLPAATPLIRLKDENMIQIQLNDPNILKDHFQFRKIVLPSICKLNQTFNKIEKTDTRRISTVLLLASEGTGRGISVRTKHHQTPRNSHLKSSAWRPPFFSHLRHPTSADVKSNTPKD